MFLQIMTMNDNYMKQINPQAKNLAFVSQSQQVPTIKVYMVQHPHFCNSLSVTT